MVETSLVAEMWPDVQALRGLLGQHATKAITEAVFLNDEGDWRLVAALPGVNVTGTRPIYSALDEAAQQGDVDVSLLSRLVLLDASDRDAHTLTYTRVSPTTPPKRFDVTLPSLPGYSGAVLRRENRIERLRSSRWLEEEVSAALELQSLHVDRAVRLDIGWRPDFVIHVGNQRQVLAEAMTVDRRTVKTRIRDAAGLANIAGCPVILIFAVPGNGDLELEESYGIVPVLLVDWERQGGARLREALALARRWVTGRPNWELRSH